MRCLSRAAVPSVAARRTTFAPIASSLRGMSINVNPYNPDTPGYEPGVGSRLMKTCVLQKARSWDDGVADKFKNTTYDEIFEGKKVIVFAVPGAFTGVCHNAHVPSYSKNVAAFKAKGVDSVICVSVNDPYTMNAWKKTLGASGEGIEFYGDSNGSFTHYMHREFDLKAAALGPTFRSNRYSMLVENGVIKVLKTEASPGELTVSSGEEMLKEL
jgi:peroxiredoxin